MGTAPAAGLNVHEQTFSCSSAAAVVMNVNAGGQISTGVTQLHD